MIYVLNISLIVLVVILLLINSYVIYKSGTIIKYQYYTNVDEQTQQHYTEVKNRILSLASKWIYIIVLLLLSLIILIASISYSRSVTDKKIENAKTVISVLYTSNTTELTKQYNEIVKPIVEFYNSYKLNVSNIHNLRDRHYGVTSSETTVDFIYESYNKNNGQIILIYKINNPKQEIVIKRCAVFTFYGNNITDFMEYNLNSTVNYGLE